MKKFWYLQLFSDEGATESIGETHGPASRDETTVATPKMTWQEVKADPELNQHLQQMVKERLKSARHAEVTMQTLDAALKSMAVAYGMEETYDPAALAEAIVSDRRFQKNDLKSHFRALQEQEIALREEFPGFSLEKELENPTFLRLTAPGGVSLEDAYYTVHRKELMAATAVSAARNISNAIQSGALRPQENGHNPAPVGVATFDYRSADRAWRENVKKRIRQAASRGEKVYPEELF